jgi:hypothetical protein
MNYDKSSGFALSYGATVFYLLSNTSQKNKMNKKVFIKACNYT